MTSRILGSSCGALFSVSSLAWEVGLFICWCSCFGIVAPMRYFPSFISLVSVWLSWSAYILLIGFGGVNFARRAYSVLLVRSGLIHPLQIRDIVVIVTGEYLTHDY